MDRRSETRPVAGPVDKERIERAIADAESHVARMEPSPRTQHLRGALDSFRRTLAGWSASPPNGEELQVLRDRVLQTLEVARTTSPTLKLRRLA
jgi:hypothetical protein